jgi:hypothetical protein
MPRGINGERLYPSMTLKLFLPDNKKPFVRILRPPRGLYFNAELIEKQLLAAATEIEQKLPGQEYRLVPIGPAAFNFVCAGEKAATS